MSQKGNELSLIEIVLGTNLSGLVLFVKGKKVVLTHGESDETAPTQYAQQLANYFTDAVFVAIDACDYLFFLKQLQLVCDFIRNGEGE